MTERLTMVARPAGASQAKGAKVDKNGEVERGSEFQKIEERGAIEQGNAARAEEERRNRALAKRAALEEREKERRLHMLRREVEEAKNCNGL